MRDEREPGSTVCLKKPQVGEGILMAFDYGERRVGIATGSVAIGIAHPLVTVSYKSKEVLFQEIGRYVSEWEPCGFVVGMPTHADDSIHSMAKKINRFCGELRSRYKLDTYLVNESYTSAEAETAVSNLNIGLKERKLIIDMHAAQILLTDFFIQNPRLDNES